LASLTAFFAGGKFLLLALALLYVVPLGIRIILAKLASRGNSGGEQQGP
jgi:hypothetical protein